MSDASGEPILDHEDVNFESKIVQIQIHKNKFNGEDVKLILVRSMDFLIFHQSEFQKIRKDQSMHKLFYKELSSPLNNVVINSRLLLDDILVLQNDVQKVARKENDSIIRKIWSQSKIQDYLLKSLLGRKRFQEENNTMLNLSEQRLVEVNQIIQELKNALSPQIDAY